MPAPDIHKGNHRELPLQSIRYSTGALSPIIFTMTEEKETPDGTIDLRNVLCPMNFVKTKLKLEEMESGEILEVFLDDGEPMRSVPRSIKEEGHKIIKVDNLGKEYRILIKKG